MIEDSKTLKGTTIQISDNVIKLIPESQTLPWWRKSFDREKDSLLCPEVFQDIKRIFYNLTKINEEGIRVGKYNLFTSNLKPNPRSSQGSGKKEYKQFLVELLSSKKKDLMKFKDKKVLIYLIVYLREKRFESDDIDNFIKVILDAVKEYIGDDKNVISVHAEKRLIKGYPKKDLDFIEQTLLVITDPAAQSELFKIT